MTRIWALLLLPLVGAAGFVLSGGHADEQKATAGASATTPPNDPQASAARVKTLFASNCSWCHGNYGMAAGQGPMLAGTTKTLQQVHDQIHNGEEGYMPPFKDTLNEEQIWAFAYYIKSLVPPPE
jgi:mono/diheme cytochrome c family protein